MTTGRQISNVDITTAFGAAADGASWVTEQSPVSKFYIATHVDDQNRATRRLTQNSGRTDFFAYDDYGQGPPLALVFDSATPANNQQAGHYAFRLRDSSAQLDTIAATYSFVENVSAASMSSNLEFGVMHNVNTGSGDAQPNMLLVFSGQNLSFTLPSSFAYNTTGSSNPFSASHTSGPTMVLTNTTNSIAVSVGCIDNFNGGIAVTGGGSAYLKSNGVIGITTNGVTNTLGIPTKINSDSRVSKTATYPIVATDGGAEFDNLAATGAVPFTLPTPAKGLKFGFTVTAAQSLQVTASSGVTINLGGVVSAAAGNIASSQIGASVELEATDTTHWVAKRVTGSGGTSAATGGWTVT